MQYIQLFIQLFIEMYTYYYIRVKMKNNFCIAFILKIQMCNSSSRI